MTAVEHNPDSTPLTCYRHGCRHPDCRQAATLETKRWEVRRARNGGPLLVDAGPLAAILKTASTAGVNLRQLADKSGVSYPTIGKLIEGRRDKIHVYTVAKLVEPLADAISRQAYYAHKAERELKAVLEPNPSGRSFPVGPLLEAIRRAAASNGYRTGVVIAPLDANMRRNLYRVSWLSEPLAERYCDVLGFMPETVWADWNGAA